MVGSHFIPEGTTVRVHTYSLHRSENCFSYPESFWPDRFLKPEDRKSLTDGNKPFESNENFVHNTTAFIPFSTGPRSCPGKGLALMEMRLVTAYIMQRFNMSVAKGFEVAQWEKTLGDIFIMKKDALLVNLSERAH